MDEDQIRRAFASQQRQFDDELADFRQFYESFTPEERERFRAWLEKAKAVETEADEWNVVFRICTEYDVIDDDGNLLRPAGSEFTLMTMLRAIRAWDEGENLAPNGPLP